MTATNASDSHSLVTPGWVAVDLGNTTANVALVRGNMTKRDIRWHAVSIAETSWEFHLVKWVRNALDDGPADWLIASVHRKATERLRAAVQDREHAGGPGAAGWVECASHQVPMPKDVDNHQQVGIDRLVAAYAATVFFGTPVIVVDAGTAITVDYVDASGTYCGGVIMPGMRMQAKSLAQDTDSLPLVDQQVRSNLDVPARNTQNAIASGIVLGTAGAIDRIIERYLQRTDRRSPPAICVSGGDGMLLSPHLHQTHRVDQNLVCRGLLELAQRGQFANPSTASGAE